MTLTEQRKNGNLKDGFYYVKLVNEEGGKIITDKYCSSFRGWEGSENWQISEVLAPVPSYEEWQELKEFADYSLHNRDELTRQINFWMDKHTQIEKENQQLKNLLKEIRGKLKYINTPKNQHNIFGNVIMTKIDEVLK